MSLSNHDTSIIRSTFHNALQNPDLPLTTAHGTLLPLITNLSFIELLSFNSPINDSIIHGALQVLHHFDSSLKSLDTNFSDSLLHHGWAPTFKKYFLHENSSRYAKTTKHKPNLFDHTIIIPYFVQGSHWVALVRRNISNQIYFYYSDDLNSPNTYNSIRSSLSAQNTSDTFRPKNSIWINIKSVTYHPHSYECRQQTLLALIAIATHPSPHELLSLPFMHTNLAQICRWWLARLLIFQQLNLHPFHDISNQLPSLPWPSYYQPTHPANLAHLYDVLPPLQPPPSSTNTLQSNTAHSPCGTIPVDFPHVSSPSTFHSLNYPNTTSSIIPSDPSTIPKTSKTQQTLDKWMVHRPFISGVPFYPSKTDSYEQIHPPYPFITYLPMVHILLQ